MELLEESRKELEILFLKLTISQALPSPVTWMNAGAFLLVPSLQLNHSWANREIDDATM